MENGRNMEENEGGKGIKMETGEKWKKNGEKERQIGENEG